MLALDRFAMLNLMRQRIETGRHEEQLTHLLRYKGTRSRRQAENSRRGRSDLTDNAPGNPSRGCHLLLPMAAAPCSVQSVASHTLVINVSQVIVQQIKAAGWVGLERA